MARVFVRERFTLRNANVDIGDGTVTLEGFALHSGNHGEGGARVEVEQLQLGVDTNPLGAVGTVRSVLVRGMAIDLDLTSGDVPDLADVLRLDDTGLTSAGSGNEPPPPIKILDSEISLRLTPGEAPVRFSNVNLELLPEEAGGARMVLRGSMSAPSGHQVIVSGGGDISTPDFRALLEIEDFSLQPEIAGPYYRPVVEYLHQIGVGGTAERLMIWAEYHGTPESGHDEFVAGVRIDLSEVSCTVPEMPYPLVDAEAQISASSRDGGTVEFKVGDRSVNYQVSASGRLRQVFSGQPIADIRFDAEGVLVDPVLGRALDVIKETRFVWKGFEPSGGRADAAIRLWNETPGEPLNAEVDLDLHGVGARFVGFPESDGTRSPGFPVPLEDIRGQVRIRSGEVFVDDVRARLLGGEVELKGSVKTRKGSLPTIALDIQSRELEFRDEFRDALGSIEADLPEVWDEYSPRGHASLDVGLRFGPGIEAPGAYIDIHPLAASASWTGFPYRIDNLQGVVRVDPQGLRIELEGSRGEAQVQLDGRFSLAKTENPGRSELWIHATDLRTEPELLTALQEFEPAVSKARDYIGFEGLTEVELSMWQEPGSDHPTYDVRIDVAEGTALLDDLRIPLSDLQGPLFIHGSGRTCQVDIGGIRGHVENGPDLQPADLLVHGGVTACDDVVELDVTSVVRGLELTDSLADALDQNGTFRRDSWERLAPSGTVDTITRLTGSPSEGSPRTELWLQLDGVRSDAEFLPAPAEDLYGAVTVDGGRATFSDIRGRMAGSAVHCAKGEVRQEENQTRFIATVSADRFPVDHRLGRLMNGPLREAYEAREMDGWLRVDEFNLDLTLPDDGSQMTSRFSGSFAALDLRMMLGGQIEDIRGRWTIADGSRIDSDGGTVEGSIDQGSFRFENHHVTGINARFHSKPDLLALDSFEANLHGGAIRGDPQAKPALTYRYDGEGELSYDLQWESISLSRLIAASGVQLSDWRGNVSGDMRLEQLIGTRFIDAKGEAQVRIRDGSLGTVPMFKAIYGYLSPRRHPSFEGGSVSIDVRDRVTRVEDLELNSPLLTAKGRGTVDMGGYIDMTIDFPDLFGKSADWLVLPPVLRYLTTSVVQFQIFGYVRNPSARPLWLWQDKAKRTALTPLPASDDVGR